MSGTREILLLCHFLHFDPMASQIAKKLIIGNCGILLAYFSDFYNKPGELDENSEAGHQIGKFPDEIKKVGNLGLSKSICYTVVTFRTGT